VIGGSGFYKLHLKVEREIDILKEVPDWPYGPTSSPITIAVLPSGHPVAFLARHGHHHTLTPSHVPARSNIAALKYIGVQAIVAFSAVGSLREEIKPRDLIIPDQIIDRTKVDQPSDLPSETTEVLTVGTAQGIRPSTFFDGDIVAHAMFGEPFDTELISLLKPLIQKAITDNKLEVSVHSEKTAVCMEGPQFSTRAESKIYRQWGGTQ
jgi:5'-methylthioadenosine phosphorylase